MKIVILAAGDSSRNFPLFIGKPKCLYSYNGIVQIDKPINSARKICDDKDICIVAGYKADHIIKYIKSKYPAIRVLVNAQYDGATIYSFRTGLRCGNDDYLFLSADESISDKNLMMVAKSDKKMALLCHDDYYYYSLGFFKLRKDVINLINDDCYLSMEYMKKIYCFANKKEVYDGDFRIYDGVCGGYVIIDLVRRIGNIKEICNPCIYYKENDIDFIHYNPKLDYVPDLDYFNLTDEYHNNFWLRLYSNMISDNIKRIHRHIFKESKFK